MSEQNMTSEIVSLRNENDVLKEELALANQQLEWFRKQIFGRKTEQTSVVIEEEFGVQLSMFGEAEKQTQQPKETVTIPEHQRKRKRTHYDWMSSLEIKEEHHEIKNPVCEICDAEMVEIDKEKVYETCPSITIAPRMR